MLSIFIRAADYSTGGPSFGRRMLRALRFWGIFDSTIRTHRINCDGYGWYARAFMMPHIEIESDPTVWQRVESLIRSKLY